MTISRIEDRQLNPDMLDRLTKRGPVIITRNGTPRFIVHRATPEWLEVLALEEDRPGDMPLEEYARLYNIPMDTESYLRESPEDAPYTTPPTDAE
jgi:hypothetical protein